MKGLTHECLADSFDWIYDTSEDIFHSSVRPFSMACFIKLTYSWLESSFTNVDWIYDTFKGIFLGVSALTLMLLVAMLADTKCCKNPEKSQKPWHIGTHMKGLSERFPMSTNMKGFRWFSKIFAFLCFGWK